MSESAKQPWAGRLLGELRSWALTLLVVGVVWMVVQSLRGGLSLPDQAPPWSGVSLDGAPLSLTALRGKPTVLYFFASWCSACKLTSPTVARFAQANPGVQVVGIAAEDADSARAYLREHPKPFPVMAETAEVDRAYRVRALPTTVVVDAEGKVRWSRQGVLLPWELDWHLP